MIHCFSNYKTDCHVLEINLRAGSPSGKIPKKITSSFKSRFGIISVNHKHIRNEKGEWDSFINSIDFPSFRVVKKTMVEFWWTVYLDLDISIFASVRVWQEKYTQMVCFLLTLMQTLIQYARAPIFFPCGAGGVWLLREWQKSWWCEPRITEERCPKRAFRL